MPGAGAPAPGPAAARATLPLLDASARWRLMVPLLAVPLVLLAHAQGWRVLLYKPYHEALAPPLLALSVLAFGLSWRRSREPAVAWLAVLATGFLCREIHFEGSNVLLEITLAGLVTWAGFARKALLASARRLPARGWLAAALLGYVLSQVVARRVFKAVPGEQAVHVALEEMLETWSHVLFLVAAGAAWRRPPRSASLSEAARP